MVLNWLGIKSSEADDYIFFSPYLMDILSTEQGLAKKKGYIINLMCRCRIRSQGFSSFRNQSINLLTQQTTIKREAITEEPINLQQLLQQGSLLVAKIVNIQNLFLSLYQYNKQSQKLSLLQAL